VLNLPPVRDLMPGGFLGYGQRPFDRMTAMAIDYSGQIFRIRGRVVAECAGHALHAELVRALLRDHAAWTIETATPHLSGFEHAVATA
ncbi:MAG TPA: hypothetical protein PKU70_10935, partial [Vicinamibacteria bacterium]|nr:hypothetical protein [Vicinamibacteria bacterium]